MKAVFLNKIVLLPVRDDQHAGIEQDDIPLRRKHLEVIDRRAGGQHDSLGVLDEALVVSTHAQLIVEQPRRHGHFAEAVGVDDVQREHSFVCQAPSPREREVIIRRSPPKSGQFSGFLRTDQQTFTPSINSDTETPNPAANLETVSSEQVLPHFTAEIVPRATPERSASCFPVNPLFVKATTKEIRFTFI